MSFIPQSELFDLEEKLLSIQGEFPTISEEIRRVAELMEKATRAPTVYAKERKECEDKLAQFTMVEHQAYMVAYAWCSLRGVRSSLQTAMRMPN